MKNNAKYNTPEKIESQYEKVGERITKNTKIGFLITVLASFLSIGKGCSTDPELLIFSSKSDNIKRYEFLDLAHRNTYLAQHRLYFTETEGAGYNPALVDSVNKILEGPREATEKARRELGSLLSSARENKEAVQSIKNKDEATMYQAGGLVGLILSLIALFGVPMKLHSLNEKTRDRRLKRLEEKTE